MKEKNIGVIEWFDDHTQDEFCGCIKIKFSSQTECIKNAKNRFCLARIMRSCQTNSTFENFFKKNDIVCFDLIENPNGETRINYVKNIRKAVGSDLIIDCIISHENNYSTTKEMLNNSPNKFFKGKFFEELFLSKKFSDSYKWIVDDFFDSFSYWQPDDEEKIIKSIDWKIIPMNVLIDSRMINDINFFISSREDAEKCVEKLLQQYKVAPNKIIFDLFVKIINQWSIDPEDCALPKDSIFYEYHMDYFDKVEILVKCFQEFDYDHYVKEVNEFTGVSQIGQSD